MWIMFLYINISKSACASVSGNRARSSSTPAEQDWKLSAADTDCHPPRLSIAAIHSSVGSFRSIGWQCGGDAQSTTIHLRTHLGSVRTEFVQHFHELKSLQRRKEMPNFESSG